ncbi:MAG: HAD family hydrolase [Actinobacteria bacterium]|nr:HAD family hydrolase [Actinomycetota bacterium]
MTRRLSGIRAVTYDCWATLLKDHDFDKAMGARAAALADALDLPRAEADTLLNEAWSRHDEAWKQVETFGPGRMAAYCLEARGIFDDEAIASLTQKFEEASLEGGVDAVEGAAETLQALERAGFRRGLICDTGFTPGRVVRRLLENLGLASYLEVMCFSDEVGVPKPGGEIYAKALADLGVRPPEAVHVGDLRRTDIAGARDMGMHAARFRGVHDDRTDASDAQTVIDRHEQILEVVGPA